MQAVRWILVACLLLVTTACTNSPLVWKTLYGQFDNVLRKEILSYANFDDSQKAEIVNAVDATVRWHRTQALPEYVELFAEAQARLIDQTPNLGDIEWLYQSGLSAAEDFETNSPILKILGLVAALSDEQVDQVKEKLEEEFEEQREKIEKEQDKDQAVESTKGFRKFMQRLGLKLTKQQAQAVTDSFRQRQLDDQLRMEAWSDWSQQLYQILDKRGSYDFESAFTQHYTKRMTLIQTTYPDKWRADQELSKQMMLNLFRSLNDGQRDDVRERLALLSDVAIELSQEEN